MFKFEKLHFWPLAVMLCLIVYNVKRVSAADERNLENNDGYCDAYGENCNEPVADEAQHSNAGYVYRNTRPGLNGEIPEWDPNGYVIFCPCMGRTGNQIDHFLGAMAFAKNINRTLVIPPLRTYRNVRFTEWFKFEPLREHHRVVLAEDFLEFLAPTYWPKGKRIGFCWQPHNSKKSTCDMKKGNPFGPFWDGLDIDFDEDIVYHFNHAEAALWPKNFPPAEYPVLAFRGAPAHFPVLKEYRHLQRYLVPSERIENEAQSYIDDNFKGQVFVGIHIRLGSDWENACKHAVGQPFYMASPQCLEDKPGKKVTKELCFPPKSEILRLTKNKVMETKAKVVFVATDKVPMLGEIEQHLEKQKVKVYHMNPHLPVVDLTILTKADYFIGSCVSSFTAYVKRARDVANKPSAFWGLD